MLIVSFSFVLTVLVKTFYSTVSWRAAAAALPAGVTGMSHFIILNSDMIPVTSLFSILPWTWHEAFELETWSPTKGLGCSHLAVLTSESGLCAHYACIICILCMHLQEELHNIQKMTGLTRTLGNFHSYIEHFVHYVPIMRAVCAYDLTIWSSLFIMPHWTHKEPKANHTSLEITWHQTNTSGISMLNYVFYLNILY